MSVDASSQPIPTPPHTQLLSARRGYYDILAPMEEEQYNRKSPKPAQSRQGHGHSRTRVPAKTERDGTDYFTILQPPEATQTTILNGCNTTAGNRWQQDKERRHHGGGNAGYCDVGVLPKERAKSKAFQQGLQPTPINEESKLRIVLELPLLSGSLLEDRYALGLILQPLLDEGLLFEDKGTTTHNMKAFPLDDDEEDNDLETSSSPAKVPERGEKPSWDQEGPDGIPPSFLSKSLCAERRETLRHMVRPLLGQENAQSCSEGEGIAYVTSSPSSSSAPSGNETPRKRLDRQQQHQEKEDDHEDAEAEEGNESQEGPDQQQNNDAWAGRYKDLLAYNEEHGNCNVPYHYAPNPKLSLWVKRQRHQYRLKGQGGYSTLRDERHMLLDAAGFVWDSRASNWEDRLEELRVFREEFGHIRISMNDDDHRHLAVWLKRQRHNARKLHTGDKSTGMTDRQLHQLLSLGVTLNTHLAKGSGQASAS